MIKRCFAALLLVMILVLIFPPTALADVIIPPPDDFFRRNSNDCVYVNRNYYANGESGLIILRTEPGSNREVAKIVNGEIVNISYTYNRNGETWGVIIYDTEGDFEQRRTGWVPIAHLAPVYNSATFEEERGSEFHAYTGGVDDLFDAREIVVWAWPGSGVVEWVMNDPSTMRNRPNILTNQNKTLVAYEDGEGREWIAITYRGDTSVWICLSDPSNPDIPAFNRAPVPELWPPGDGDPLPGGARSKHLGGVSMPVLIIILVAGLAIVTAVLIRVFWKKNKTETTGTE